MITQHSISASTLSAELSVEQMAVVRLVCGVLVTCRTAPPHSSNGAIERECPAEAVPFSMRIFFFVTRSNAGASTAVLPVPDGGRLP